MANEDQTFRDEKLHYHVKDLYRAESSSDIITGAVLMGHRHHEPDSVNIFVTAAELAMMSDKGMIEN